MKKPVNRIALLVVIIGSIIIIGVVIGIISFIKAFEDREKAMHPPVPGTAAYVNYVKAISGSDRENALLDHAVNLEKAGSYEEAISEYKRIINSVSSKMIAHEAQFELVNCYEKIGNYKEALIQLDILIKNSSAILPEFLDLKSRLEKKVITGKQNQDE
jgi:tetratricopeptide (TPR) repeat protein